MTMTKGEKAKHIWNREEPQSIAVPLLGQNAPHNGNTDHQRDYDFVGREPLIKELLTVLNETRNKKGCYLISGFRGSGKTTLIKKVLAIYKRREKGPSWLPAVSKDAYSWRFNSILGRARKKLKACSRGSKSKPFTQLAQSWLDKIWGFIRRRPSIIKKYIFPNRLIKVSVNLGQDELLSPKDVLFDTATLLHHEFHDERKYTELVPCAITVVLVTWAVQACLGEWFSEWLRKLLRHPELPGWLDWMGLPSPAGDPLNSWLFFGTGITGVIYYLWTRHFRTNTRILHLLKRLNKRMAYVFELNKGIQSHGFSFGRKEIMPPLDARQIENELLYILKECRKVFRFLCRPDIVFVFDELDKIAYRREKEDVQAADQPSVGRDQRGRKRKVDDLLGALKNFTTHGSARFFFIAGREMLDSYQAERGSTSSLYESLFKRVFEVPSLLTDPSDHNQQRMHSLVEVYVCRKLMDPDIAIYLWLKHTNHHRDDDPYWEEDLHRKLMYSPFCLRTYYHYLHFIPDISGREARRIVLGLRNFIQYLTLHSWGNPKRMESLFAQFTKHIDSVDWRQEEDVKNMCGCADNVKMVLQFGLIDQQRIVLASNLYTQLYHDLGRQLASSGDKLVVSTMAAFQYILKFHRHPFNRYHLERMSETVSTYRSPELNTMIDTLISKIFHPHVRRIRNSHYRYRFSGAFEQELRYISRVNDVESAAFNFSLDAAAPIKAHYLDQLNGLLDKKHDGVESDVTIYELCIIIGDLYALEQSHNEALVYFNKATSVFDGYLEDGRIQFAHLHVEALLRLGEIYERRQRYDQAASTYLQARSAVNKLKTAAGNEWRDALKNGDSKWDIFRQPFWAYWYLQLKRSPASSFSKVLPPFEYPFNKKDDAVNHYRAGQLAFFCGRHVTAIGSFLKAIEHSNIATENTERATYLGAYACLHLGENLFVGMMHNLRMEFESDGIGLSCVRKQAMDACCAIVTMINGGESKDFKGDLRDLERKFEDDLRYLERKFEDDLRDLERKSKGQPQSYLEGLEDLSVENKEGHEKKSVHGVDVYMTLGMMAYAARRLADSGLHYHAALAYLKILSIWGMFSEIIFALTKISGESIDVTGKAPLWKSCASPMLKESEKWVTEVRKRAEESMNSITAGGYSRFHARWKSRDVAGLPEKQTIVIKKGKTKKLTLSKRLDKDGVIDALVNNERKTDFKLKDKVFHNIPLNNILDLLFPDEDDKDYDTQTENSELLDIAHEAILLQRSMMGQKLIYLSTWEYMAKIKFRSRREPFIIPRQTMTPHSTSNLMFSHWLAGRHCLHWRVLDKFLSSNPQQMIDREKIYEDGAAAVHNLHRAIYYIRQLSGNDQDMMFPDPSLVFYDLWQLLYALVAYEKKLSPDKQHNDLVKPAHDDFVKRVKDKLSASNLFHDFTPANFYDFKNVTQRTIDALRDAELLWDVSNRVRSDAIRTRHFLADDYEDSRFHLDWTLVQMYSPTAGILRRYVESASKELSDTA